MESREAGGRLFGGGGEGQAYVCTQSVNMKRMVVGTQSSLLSPPYRSTIDHTKTALIILQYACPRGGSTESKTCLVSRMVAFYHHRWNFTTLSEPWVILNLDISLRMRSTLMWFGPSRHVWNPPKKLPRFATPALRGFLAVRPQTLLPSLSSPWAETDNNEKVWWTILQKYIGHQRITSHHSSV